MASPHSASSSPASALGTGDNHAMMPEGGTETRPLPPVSSFVRITLVGSAILGVVALLPYGLLRARISRIERSMDHIAAVSAATERDLQKLLELNAVRRGEHKQLSGLVAETKNSMEEMRRAGERRENEQRATNERVLRGVHDVKAAVERAEGVAEAGHLAGTEWRRDLLNKFRWTAGSDNK